MKSITCRSQFAVAVGMFLFCGSSLLLAANIGFVVSGGKLGQPLLDPFDQGWTNHLVSVLGHNVVRMYDNDGSLQSTVDMLIISSDVASGTANNNYDLSTSQPMLITEYGLYDDIGFGSGGANVGNAGPLTITILDSSHPLAAGLSGEVTVYSGANNTSYLTGTAAGGLTQVATSTAGPIIGVLDAGALNLNGVPAPGIRMMGHGYDITLWENLTADGLKLLDAQIAYAFPVLPTSPKVTSRLPLPATTQAHPQPVIQVEITDYVTQVDPTTIALSVDDVVIVPQQVSKAGDVTSVLYEVPTILDPASTHTAQIVFSDMGGTEVTTATNAWQFTIADWVALTASDRQPLATIDVSAPGFVYDTVQARFDANLEATEARAVAQLRGKLIDPLTGVPFADESLYDATLDPPQNPDGTWNLDRVNLNLYDIFLGTLFAPEGLFSANNAPPYDDPEQKFPGIPGTDFFGNWDNFASELTVFLELDAGAYTLGVTSDEGFVAYAGPNPKDLFAKTIGRLDGGPSPGAVLFSVVAEQDGAYPIRLVHYQSDFGSLNPQAGLEFFSVNPTNGQATLINAAAGIPAWRAQTAPALPPYTFWVEPAAGAVEIALDDVVEIELRDDGMTVDTNTISLTFAGSSVTPDSIATVDGVTTITYDPPGDMAQGTVLDVMLEYADSGAGSHTAAYSFITELLPVGPPVDQGPDGLVRFEAEHFNTNTAPAEYVWSFSVTEPNYSGLGYMRSLPTGDNLDTLDEIANLSPRLDYNINFLTTGVHQVWVRALTTGGDNSIHLGLDGTLVQMNFSPPDNTGVWVWDNDGAITNLTPGVHTLNIWARETGFRLDRVVLTPDATLQPLSVDLVSPTNDQSVAAGTPVALEADAFGFAAIAQVEFFAGANKIGEASAEPYQAVWADAAPGQYSVTARVTDELGGTATSAAVNLTVAGAEGAVLSIAPSGADLVISWEDAGPTQALHSALNLVSPTWQPVPEPVVVVGSNRTVTVTPANESESYRLQSP